MALQKCHECGNDVSSDAKICPKCGAKVKQKTSTFTWLIAGLLGVGFLSSMLSTDVTPAPTAPQTTAAAGAAVPASVVAPVPKPPPSAASAIAEGEALVKRDKAGDVWGRAALAGKTPSTPPVPMIAKVEWAEAKESLGSIDKGKPEYPKAQAVLKAMAERDKKNAEFTAAEDSKYRAQRRKEFAANLEQAFIERRMNTNVSASGPQSTTLRIEYVLASKVTANDLSKSDIIQQAQSAGFKVVKFTDGYDSTWTWNLK